jgi:hypothetical protein
VCEHKYTSHGYDCATCEACEIRNSCAVDGCSCYQYTSVAELLDDEEWHAEQWDGYRSGRLTRTGRVRAIR